MKLSEILSLEQWKNLEKEIHEKSGMDSNVFNTKGIRITDHKEWVNRLCPVIKASDRGQSFICAVAHMNIAEIAKRTGDPVIEECDAGLTKIVVPIFVEDEFIGAVGACGLILDDGEIDSFMLNKTIGIQEKEVESLSRDIGHISTSEAEDLAEYISSKLKEIMDLRAPA